MTYISKLWKQKWEAANSGYFWKCSPSLVRSGRPCQDSVTAMWVLCSEMFVHFRLVVLESSGDAFIWHKETSNI